MPHRRLVGMLLLLDAGYLPLAALFPPPATLPLALLSGLLLAPVMACAFVMVDALAPSGTNTEAFAWTETGVLVGGGLDAFERADEQGAAVGAEHSGGEEGADPVDQVGLADPQGLGVLGVVGGVSGWDGRKLAGM